MPPKQQFLSKALEETYEDVYGMIRKICQAHQNRHGGDIEELMSVANEAFMSAVRTFDHRKGFAFTTWCYHKTRYALLMDGRKTGRHQRTSLIGDGASQLPQTRQQAIAELLRDIEGTAADIVRLLQKDPTRVKALKRLVKNMDKINAAIDVIQRIERDLESITETLGMGV